ncbi:MAG: N-acetylmuramoyl-L-alanine amidase [Betaproteobacteria bacterium]|nr:N-acetylmuramoyl-L-alanine amidase [Betaproteobacteria bacterium]
MRPFLCGAFLATAIGLASCAQPSPPAIPASRSGGALEVVPVSAWGGTPADAAKGRVHDIRRITLHHGGTTFTRDKDVAQHLRNLQAWSRREKGWIDIPYHFVIDLDGRVYEARDIRLAGDTNTEYDPAGHALVMVLGNYEEIEPTPTQLAAVADTMAMLARRYRLGVDTIGSHRDHSKQTVCPGKHLYRYLQDGRLVAAVKGRLGTP